MNSSVFSGWLEKRVFPAILPRSIVVIDRALYHTTLTEEFKPASSTRRKSKLVDRILGKAAKHEVDGRVYHTRGNYIQLKAVELAEICKRHKPKPVFRAQVLAAKFDCMALFLPVSHPELNPIEMMWAAIKAHVAKKNTTFTLVEVERLTRERIHKLGSAKWAKYVRHAVKVEDDYYDASGDISFEASEK